jgi:hypothetical protein
MVLELSPLNWPYSVRQVEQTSVQLVKTKGSKARMVMASTFFTERFIDHLIYEYFGRNAGRRLIFSLQCNVCFANLAPRKVLHAMRYLLFVLFTMLLAFTAKAQSQSNNVFVRATVGDSVLRPGQLYAAQPSDRVLFEIMGGSEAQGYRVCAQSVKIVSQRSMGAGTELPGVKFPAGPDAPCSMNFNMPKGRGNLKFTLVVEGLYIVKDGKRKFLNIPIGERSFPMSVTYP